MNNDLKMNQLLYLTLLFIITLVDCTFNETGQQEIVDAINEVRRAAFPRGANLREVRWDPCLAELAAINAHSCGEIGSENIYRQSHAVELGCVSSGQRIGETTFYISAPLASNTQAIEAWIKQIPSYKYDDHTCRFICEDYIQLVWFQTYLVGCATIDEAECGKSGTTVVCDYRMSSVDEFKPYMKGEPCSACEENWSVCNEGLCTQPTKTTSEQLTTTTASIREQTTTTPVDTTEQPTTTQSSTTAQPATTISSTTAQPTTTTTVGTTREPTSTNVDTTEGPSTLIVDTTEQPTPTTAGTTETPTTTVDTTEQPTPTTAGTTETPTTTVDTTEQPTPTTAGTTETPTTTVDTTKQSTPTTVGTTTTTTTVDTTEQPTPTTAGTTETPTTTVDTTEQPTPTTVGTTETPTTTVDTTEQPTPTTVGTTDKPTTITGDTTKQSTTTTVDTTEGPTTTVDITEQPAEPTSKTTINTAQQTTVTVKQTTDEPCLTKAASSAEPLGQAVNSESQIERVHCSCASILGSLGLTLIALFMVGMFTI